MIDPGDNNNNDDDDDDDSNIILAVCAHTHPDSETGLRGLMQRICLPDTRAAAGTCASWLADKLDCATGQESDIYIDRQAKG